MKYQEHGFKLLLWWWLRSIHLTTAAQPAPNLALTSLYTSEPSDVTTYSDGSCISLQRSPLPWLMLDLWGAYRIHNVSFTNDGIATAGLTILIGDTLVNDPASHPELFVTCNALDGPYDVKEHVTSNCTNNTVGRYVVVLPGNDTSSLDICDLVVLGDPMSNLAYQRPAYTSSSEYIYWGTPDKGVNSLNTAVWALGDCVLTKMERLPWFLVDLGGRYNVMKVAILSMAIPQEVVPSCNCAPPLTLNSTLDGAIVAVGNSFDDSDPRAFDPWTYDVCTQIVRPVDPGTWFGAYCHLLSGRFVTVFLPTFGSLVMCELQVYEELHVIEEDTTTEDLTTVMPLTPVAPPSLMTINCTGGTVHIGLNLVDDHLGAASILSRHNDQWLYMGEHDVEECRSRGVTDGRAHFRFQMASCDPEITKTSTEYAFRYKLSSSEPTMIIRHLSLYTHCSVAIQRTVTAQFTINTEE